MSYRLESIEIFVRALPPGRMRFVLGKAGRDSSQSAKPKPRPPAQKRRPGGFLVTRAIVVDGQGRRAVGMSGDRPSYGWLDKRPQYSGSEKPARLLALVKAAREVYLAAPAFASPFAIWRSCNREIQRLGREADHEPLSASFASALFERAIVDAVCRLHDATLFEAVKNDLLGVDPGEVFPQLKDIRIASLLPKKPRTRIFVRHTVGGADPLTEADWPKEERVDDGEPETLEEYISRDGVRFFKVKVSGDPEGDFDRLQRIWQVVMHAEDPVVTLDGNESYDDLDSFSRLVELLEEKAPGLFQHMLFIEQPMPRALTHDPATTKKIHKIAGKKDLVIDEADGELDAFPNAFAIGYSGVSHKNCKGFFKSLLNLAWCHHFEDTTDRNAFMSGEDLSNMPLVPLHQDYAALGLLDIDHCERNGHHYTYGMPFLTAQEKRLTREHHPDLYTERRGEMFLNIQDGAVDCASLQTTGFGVAFEPEWEHLIPFEEWEEM